jgi:hypothetical protein
VDIRCNARDMRRLEKVRRLTPSAWRLTLDENAVVPVAMVHDEGTFKEFLRGVEGCERLLRYGFNRITRSCPYRHRRCIGERCSLYFVQGLTGDCVHIWQMFRK